MKKIQLFLQNRTWFRNRYVKMLCLTAVLLISPCHPVSAESAPAQDMGGIDWNWTPIRRFLYVAGSQLGYHGTFGTNESVYADWAGSGSGDAWCSEFASWCAYQAGIPASIIPVSKSYAIFRNLFSEMGRYYYVDNGKDNVTCGCMAMSGGKSLTVDQIRPGDILLISSSNAEKYKKGPAHTAICKYVDGKGRIHTIEGNVKQEFVVEEDTVCGEFEVGVVVEKVRKANTIHGVCRPDYSSYCGGNHQWVKLEKPVREGTCTLGAIRRYQCAACYETKDVEEAPLPHTPVSDAGYEPTYLKEGRTKGSHCSVCNLVLEAQTPIPICTIPSEGEKLKDPSTKAIYKIRTAAVIKKGKITGGTVSYFQPPKSNLTVAKIPSKITLDGITYKVTGISAKAFCNCGKLKQVTLPSSLDTIGKRAFYGCKKLKKITVKTKKLKKSNVGTNAFKGIASKAVFDVPNSKKKSYKKIFLAKGAGKKITCR